MKLDLRGTPYHALRRATVLGSAALGALVGVVFSVLFYGVHMLAPSVFTALFVMCVVAFMEALRGSG